MKKLLTFGRWLVTSPIGFMCLCVLTALVLKIAGHDPLGVLIAGTVGSTATADGLLKDYYDDEWVSEGVNNKIPLTDIIEDKGMDKRFGGRRVIYGMHIRRNKSPFAAGEYSLFAEADIQTTIPVTVDARKMMGRTLLTPELMADSAQDEMAWEDAEENNFDRLTDDLARRAEMMLSYDGRGVLGRINEASPNGNTTLIVDAPGGVSGSVFGNRFFETQTYIGAVDPTTGALRAGICKVTALSTDGNSVTTDAAPNAAWAENDYLVKAANSTVTDVLDTEYENWFWGLLGIFDDGTYRADYGGVDRTVVDNANTYVNASTGVLSMDTLQMLSDILDTRCGGVTSLILGHSSVRRLYLKLTQADRRYSGENLMAPDAGTKAFTQKDITIGNVDFRVIRDFPFGTMLGIDTEKAKLRRYVSTKGEWVRNGSNGDILVRMGTGSTARDAFEAWYRMRYQWWAKMPSAAWRADGITGATVPIVRPLGDN